MKKQSQLKIYIHTNDEVNKNISQLLVQSIARSIYQSEDFQNTIMSKEIQPAS